MKRTHFYNHCKKYYDAASSESDALANPALMRLASHVKDGMKVLDVGCGEGSKLISLGKGKRLAGFGVDVSKQGIERARSKRTRYKFSVCSPKRIPFPDSTFDIVYSTYVFEHLTNPQRTLDEMIRVAKRGGRVIIVCPNFGSPIYPSPITPKLGHVLYGLSRDVRYIFSPPRKLDWKKQVPRLDEDFKPDFDTTVLPYAYSLKKLYPLAIASSTWDAPIANTTALKIARFPFMILGRLGIYPFKWWGPVLYFELVKP